MEHSEKRSKLIETSAVADDASENPQKYPWTLATNSYKNKKLADDTCQAAM